MKIPVMLMGGALVTRRLYRRVFPTATPHQKRLLPQVTLPVNDLAGFFEIVLAIPAENVRLPASVDAL